MPNGIKVDEETFAGMDHDDQIKSIFHAIVTTNENFCKQPPICELKMDQKISLNNRLRRKINLGIGGLGAGGVVGLIEGVKSWLLN